MGEVKPGGRQGRYQGRREKGRRRGRREQGLATASDAPAPAWAGAPAMNSVHAEGGMDEHFNKRILPCGFKFVLSSLTGAYKGTGMWVSSAWHVGSYQVLKRVFLLIFKI